MGAMEGALKNFAADPPTEVEIKAFKMVCPLCGSTQFSIDELPAAGRPKDWPPEVLGVANCRGCQRVCLVTLPQELAWILRRHIPSVAFPKQLCEALGLPFGNHQDPALN